jgi:hypothetical protein
MEDLERRVTLFPGDGFSLIFSSDLSVPAPSIEDLNILTWLLPTFFGVGGVE